MARREWVVRKGASVSNALTPAYRYIATDGEFYIVEYCNQIKRLPKSEYELR